jgi:hypothetical protein
MMDCTKLTPLSVDTAWSDEQAARRAERKVKAETNAKHRQQAAAEAAGALWTTAEWQGSELHVDASVLLGTALTSAPAKWLAWHNCTTAPAGTTDLGIERSKLAAARRVLRPFRAGLRAWFADGALHLRWRGGLGGLDLILSSVPKDVEVFEVLLPEHEERRAS